MLLSETLRAIESSLGVSLSPCQIKAAKFFYPTRPGDHVLIDFSRSGGSQIRFTCTVKGKTVLAGEMNCDATPTAA